MIAATLAVCWVIDTVADLPRQARMLKLRAIIASSKMRVAWLQWRVRRKTEKLARLQRDIDGGAQ